MCVFQPSGAPQQLGVSCLAPLHQPLVSSTAEVETTFNHHSGEPSWNFCSVFVSDLETYLPQERRSAAFKVSRCGLKQDEPLQRLSRFDSFCFRRLFLIYFILKLHVSPFHPPGSRQHPLTRNAGTCSCLQGDPSGPWSGVLHLTQSRPPSTSLWPAIRGWMTSTLSTRCTQVLLWCSCGMWAVWS